MALLEAIARFKALVPEAPVYRDSDSKASGYSAVSVRAQTSLSKENDRPDLVPSVIPRRPGVAM